MWNQVGLVQPVDCLRLLLRGPVQLLIVDLQESNNVNLTNWSDGDKIATGILPTSIKIATAWFHPREILDLPT